jgi:3-deoxy-D-manno-octulosonic-acid transferase
MGISSKQKLAVKRTAGRGLARLIRLVARTSTIMMEPPGLKAELRAAHPVIIATWHGQFMMTCQLKPDDVAVAAMVARHGDAELIGEAMSAFGVSLIRGAGAGERKERKKDRGGAAALRAGVTALKGGVDRAPLSLVMTADVPPGPARIVGEGIITIARLSGCPIVPVASATTRYKAFKTWSRLTINLPFSTLAFVGGAPIYVPRDADAATLEALRVELQGSLNAVTLRAYHLAGADPVRATPPNPASVAAKPGLLLSTYQGGMRVAQLFAGRLLAARERRGKEDGARLHERQGIAGLARPIGPLVWVHAASVGETNAVLPLIEALARTRPDVEILLTTTTVTSAKIAAARLPARARHQFIPLDTPDYTARFLDYWRPDLAIFTESEIWPNLILALAERTIPMALVNGRMSAKSFKLWKRISSMSGPLFGRFDLILAQNEKLARWFRDVGGRRVVPVGNLKADAPPPPVDQEHLARFQAALGGRPVVLAASTHEGEEVIVAAAHRHVASALPGFCTIIAPRHPQRGMALAEILKAQGFQVALRSLGEPLMATTDLYIADTIGELGTLYAACPVAFVGGSLVERGGQNPIEAVALGSALIVGPSTFNFRDEYAALMRAGGVTVVTGADALASAVVALLRDADALSRQRMQASAAMATLKGALPRSIALLLPLLPPPLPTTVETSNAQDLLRAS